MEFLDRLDLDRPGESGAAAGVGRSSCRSGYAPDHTLRTWHGALPTYQNANAWPDQYASTTAQDGYPSAAGSYIDTHGNDFGCNGAAWRDKITD